MSASPFQALLVLIVSVAWAGEEDGHDSISYIKWDQGMPLVVTWICVFCLCGIKLRKEIRVITLE